ncbi:MAG: hypothetical protein QOH25_4072 [Acidobacteriota bacterium]|jgi:hypothetical protein|nr:hypothetical protein [Acidobacteriota bacterium]
MNDELEHAYESLVAWCRERGYAGYDPFDALNSRLFQATPLKNYRAARIIWTQLFKRSPISFRKIALVPAGKNAKGTALFALAALSTFRRTRTKEAEAEARALLDALWAARLEGLSGAAWGYNFDWQSRAFFAPRGTPTIVPTAFAARALIEAALAFNDEDYTTRARSVCEFILRDLQREDETEREVCFSYTPLDRSRIFNASLLAGETLASVGALTSEPELLEWGMKTARYAVRHQRADGSWAYGPERRHAWVDNFHTAFVLLSLTRIKAACGSSESDDLTNAIRQGYEFWRTRFFVADGWPKYYHDKLYPADVHSAAAAIVALLELESIDRDAPVLAEKITAWALHHLYDARGFFYYQRRRFYTVRTPYIRWAQSWMLYALARLLEKGKH